jgi:hypothetical protein
MGRGMYPLNKPAVSSPPEIKYDECGIVIKTELKENIQTPKLSSEKFTVANLFDLISEADDEDGGITLLVLEKCGKIKKKIKKKDGMEEYCLLVIGSI